MFFIKLTLKFYFILEIEHHKALKQFVRILNFHGKYVSFNYQIFVNLGLVTPIADHYISMAKFEL